MKLAVFGMLMIGALIGWSWWKVITMPRYSRWLTSRHKVRQRRNKVLPAPDVRAERPHYDAWRRT